MLQRILEELSFVVIQLLFGSSLKRERKVELFLRCTLELLFTRNNLSIYRIVIRFLDKKVLMNNNMCQKCGRKSGLWVLHEMVNKTYAENMKKIVGAVWELPAK